MSDVAWAVKVKGRNGEWGWSDSNGYIAVWQARYLFMTGLEAMEDRDDWREGGFKARLVKVTRKPKVEEEPGYVLCDDPFVKGRAVREHELQDAFIRGRLSAFETAEMICKDVAKDRDGHAMNCARTISSLKEDAGVKAESPVPALVAQVDDLTNRLYEAELNAEPTTELIQSIRRAALEEAEMVCREISTGYGAFEPQYKNVSDECADVVAALKEKK